MDWVIQGFLALGALFALLGNLGVLLLPDVYTRLQASSTCTTTAVFSIIVAGVLSAGFSPLSGKILVIALFFLISSPIATHIIARYAWRRDILPWRRRKPRPEDSQGSAG